jgi:hypothetical protein
LNALPLLPAKADRPRAFDARFLIGQEAMMGQGVAPVRYAWGSLSLLPLAVFAVTFDPNVNRWPANFAWLAAY